MATANIIINQTGRPPGLPDQSRDDLALSVPVILTNENNSGVVAWNWRLLSKPAGSGTGLDTPTLSSCQFTPDLAGSYLVQLVVNGQTRATAIAAVKTTFLGLRIPAKGETTELGGWEAAFQELFRQLEDGIQSGGGTSDRTLLFSDDTQFTEVGDTFITKKTFRVVRDPDKPPTQWRILVSLWGSSSYGLVECRVNAIGEGGTDTVTLPSVFGNAEIVVAANLTISNANEPVGSIVTIEIQLRLVSGGGAASLQYTDVFALYAAA